MTEEVDKSAQVDTYVQLYKAVHGVKPRGIDLYNWELSDILAGIRTLKSLRN